MSNKLNKLTEYIGIADEIPDLKDPSSFKQLTIEEILNIPVEKPDIEQIVKVICKVVITNIKVIRTPASSSGEGQTLSGYKAVIEGELQEIIEYVADEPKQSVHAAHFNFPFSNFIVLPPNFKIGTPVYVNSYIEDIYAVIMSKRKIFKNVTILFTAESY